MLIKNFFPLENKKTPLLLKAQAHLPLLFDTLQRQHQCHLHITGAHSPVFNQAFLDLLSLHLTDMGMLYLDINHILLSGLTPKQLTTELKSSLQEAAKNHGRVLIVTNSFDPLSNTTTPLLEAASQLLRPLLQDANWRFLAITATANTYELPHLFTQIQFYEANLDDAVAILKSYRDELEITQQIIIPDEAFAYAYHLASHYVSGALPTLDKALQLLESASVRAGKQERQEHNPQKPIVTPTLLAQVVSSWTHIPLTHLQHNKFQTADFAQHMQKHVHGQDLAIQQMSLALQYARLKLQNKPGPLCSFLLAGPSGTGKALTATALAEYLFGHKDALIHMTLDKSSQLKAIQDIPVFTHNEDRTSLFGAIAAKPYAVVLIENLHEATHSLFHLFQDIFTLGYATDAAGNTYDFRHAILIATTTLGSESIIRLSQHQARADMSHTTDLMQLVLNGTTDDNTTHTQAHTLQELSEEIRPTLEANFGQSLLTHFNVIPFALLDYATLEKILRLQLKSLSHHLDKHYAIELTYAPEVLRFLVQETLRRACSIDMIQAQALYPCIAHELISHTTDKNRRKRLLLQLNDAGQVLRSEFVSVEEANLFKL